jgi:YD repeat-containing protein
MKKQNIQKLIIGILVCFCGLKLAAQSNNDNDKPIIKTTKEYSYKYDENDGLKSRDSIFPANFDTYSIFDENEKIIENGRYNPDGSLYQKTLYFRDKDGEAIKGISKGSNNEIKSQWSYEYDENKNLIEVLTYDSDSTLTNRQLNRFDYENSQTEMVTEDLKRNKTRKYEYKFDADENKIEQVRYNPDGSLKDKRIYQYDNNGNEKIQFLNRADGSKMKFVSEYDEMNNLLVQNWFDEGGEQTHQTAFEYNYDKHGNWITKKRISKGILNLIWEREIEYRE